MRENRYSRIETTKKICLIFHKWKPDKTRSNGFSDYFECSKCGKRKVTQPTGSIYQPVDWAWLEETNKKL